MRRWIGWATTALLGCGRIAFGPLPDATPTADAPIDAVPVPACTVTACPTAAGFVLADGGCYRLSTSDLPWLEAEQECELAGAHLVVTNNVAEHNTVHSLAADVSKVWIGWTDRREDGVFQWVAANPGGPTVSSMCFFPPGEPIPGDGPHCVTSNGANTCGDHEDVGCASTYRFVCECDGQLADPTTF